MERVVALETLRQIRAERRRLAAVLHRRHAPPQRPEGGWLTVREAAQRLQLHPEYVAHLARRGVLARQRVEGRVWLDAREVDLHAAARAARPSSLLPSTLDPRPSTFPWGPRDRPFDIAPDDRFISTRDAADILGITPAAVSNLVRRGLLPCLQKCPGKQGSPLRLSENMVHRLLERPDYQRRRAARALSDPALNPQPSTLNQTAGWPDHDLPPVPCRGRTPADRDHGDTYTTRQAADVLGVCSARIHALRRAGRLTGFQRPPRLHGPAWRREPGGGNRWWFYPKADVHALLLDPDHDERRRRYIQARAARYPDPPTPDEFLRQCDACLQAMRRTAPPRPLPPFW